MILHAGQHQLPHERELFLVVCECVCTCTFFCKGLCVPEENRGISTESMNWWASRILLLEINKKSFVQLVETDTEMRLCVCVC